MIVSIGDAGRQNPGKSETVFMEEAFRTTRGQRAFCIFLSAVDFWLIHTYVPTGFLPRWRK